MDGNNMNKNWRDNVNSGAQYTENCQEFWDTLVEFREI